jgi:hypothetical protein
MSKPRAYVETTIPSFYHTTLRASTVKPTQREAIDSARKLVPGAAIHVERVRHTSKGKPDKWRKP